MGVIYFTYYEKTIIMGDIAFTGQISLLLILFLAMIVLGVIFYFRRYYKGKSSSDLTGTYKDHEWDSPLDARNKYPDVNAFRLSRPIFLFGLATALAATLFAFSWTSYDGVVNIPDGALDFDEEIEIEPPRTAEPPPPPPPPPPPVIEEVPEEEILEEEEPVFVDQDVTEEDVIEEIVEEEAPPPPPPPPPPPEEPEIFKVVEQMPRFPGCENSGGTEKDKENCAKEKMQQYIYKNLKYPAIARENGVEGMTVLQFVVSENGTVKDIKVVRDIGAGCGDAAKKVVSAMNNLPQRWTPGKQRGRPVKVLYTLPVKFKLE